MKHMRAILWRWSPAVLVMAIIFIASSMPSQDLPAFGAWDFLLKKWGHLVGYALLGASYLNGLAAEGRITRRKLLWAIVLASVYAVSDEFHQSFTPGRNPSAADVAIDTVGAAMGSLLWPRIKALRIR